MTVAALWALVQACGGRIVAWVSEPPGSWIALLLAALLALWGIHHHGYATGRAECEAAHKAIAAGEVHRQQVAVTGVQTRSQARTNQDATTNQTGQEIVHYVTIHAAGAPDAHDACLDAATADRVRSIP